MADRADGSDDKPLGYKRPPRWSRFKKGKSGNPKGRPKGTGKKTTKEKAVAKRLTGSEEILDRLTEEKVELSRSGKKVRLTKKEALRHAQINSAIKGNALAMRDLNRDIALLEAKKAEIAKAEAEAAEQAAQEKARRDEAWWQHLVELKDKQAKAWAEAAAEGREEPDNPWPHPDDILLDGDRCNWRVRGPLTGKNVDLYEFRAAERDLLFLRDMIHLKTSKLSAITDMSIWEILWRMHDAKLPLRWQIAPCADRYLLASLDLPLRTLQRLEKEAACRADALELSDCKVRDRETYKFVNSIMKPVLGKLGYKSLAHYESIADQQGTGDTARS